MRQIFDFSLISLRSFKDDALQSKCRQSLSWEIMSETSMEGLARSVVDFGEAIFSIIVGFLSFLMIFSNSLIVKILIPFYQTIYG